jgi:proteasome inhibitor subunit 1 (PI31)
MYVGPDHPMFAGRGRGRDQEAGPWGGDGRLPPLGAPPGARFDPVGPFGRGTFPGAGRGRGGPPGTFGGDPDNDEFFPPGTGGYGTSGGHHSPFVSRTSFMPSGPTDHIMVGRPR